MISNMKEIYIFCSDFQIPTEIDSSVLKWLQRWQNLTFFVGTFKFQLKKQFSIEMISKITGLYILCGDIQVSTEKKSSLVLKWFQRWQNHALFVQTFKFQLKNHFSIIMISTIKELYILCWDIQIPTDKYRLLFKWLQRWHTLNSLLANSNFNWKKLTYFVGTFKFQLERNSSLSKWLQRWQNLTSFGRHSNCNWKKTVQYLNDFKDDKPQHPL